MPNVFRPFLLDEFQSNLRLSRWINSTTGTSQTPDRTTLPSSLAISVEWWRPLVWLERRKDMVLINNQTSTFAINTKGVDNAKWVNIRGWQKDFLKNAFELAASLACTIISDAYLSYFQKCWRNLQKEKHVTFLDSVEESVNIPRPNWTDNSSGTDNHLDSWSSVYKRIQPTGKYTNILIDKNTWLYQVHIVKGLFSFQMIDTHILLDWTANQALLSVGDPKVSQHP